MFRACVAQGSRAAVASTSSLLHTSAMTQAAGGYAGRRLSAERKKRLQEAAARAPSVVLGIRPGDEAKWLKCDLAKILVDEQALVAGIERIPTEVSTGTIDLPRQIGFGVAEEEKKLLFEALPPLSAEARTRLTSALQSPYYPADMDLQQKAYEQAEKVELAKANQFAKLLDLRNSSAGGIAFENRRRIVLAFSTPEKPFDPGRTEVQVALLTYQIRSLWNHLSKYRRDVGNRRGLRKIVHSRAKLLKYLKKVSRDRYDNLLERLALEPESVEGELVV